MRELKKVDAIYAHESKDITGFIGKITLNCKENKLR